MTTTLTVGKRGTIVIPKAMRTECKMDEGAQVEVSLENNSIVLTPSLQTRTRLDENFDEMREMLTRHGATLETAMEALYKMRRETE